MTSTRDLDRLVGREPHDPHATLGAHRRTAASSCGRSGPSASVVVVLDGGEAVEMKRVRRPRPVRGADRGRRPAAELRARGRATRTATSSPSATRTRSRRRSASSTCTSPARAATSELYERLGAHVTRARGRDRHRLRRLGAERRARSASSATSTAGTGGCTRCARSAPPGSGSCSSRTSAPASATSSSSATRDGRAAAQGRPARVPRRAPAADAPRSSRVPSHEWRDEEWLEQRRAATRLLQQPMSIYEVHLGSWRRDPPKATGSRSRTASSPTSSATTSPTSASRTSSCCRSCSTRSRGSWGYQVTATSRRTRGSATPDDFRFLVDELHAARASA